jgi:hypothetical protein
VSLLHVTNGDCAGDKLRRFVDGAVTITADPLHEGPAPGVDGDAWYDMRARFLSNGDERFDAIKAQLAEWDQVILDAARAGEVVLWFEHDLFDQLQLTRTLDMIGGADRTAFQPNASLICIDRFPGVERFIGLGQLTVDQLATLVGTEQPIRPEQYALASETWAAFRSPDPRALLQVTRRLPARPRSQESTSGGGKPDTADEGLPFLRDALLRFFAEYPSASNGLSQTAQLALETLTQGPMTCGALFAAAQSREDRPFLGDTIFFDTLRALGAARVPLMSLSSSAQHLDLRSHLVAITAAGRDVAAGRSDHVALNGIDLWRGGVHLAGTDSSPWRWDAGRETLVS